MRMKIFAVVNGLLYTNLSRPRTCPPHQQLSSVSSRVALFFAQGATLACGVPSVGAINSSYLSHFPNTITPDARKLGDVEVGNTTLRMKMGDAPLLHYPKLCENSYLAASPKPCGCESRPVWGRTIKQATTDPIALQPLTSIVSNAKGEG